LGLIVCVMIVDRLGRKYLFCWIMIFTGITYICTIFASLYGDDRKYTVDSIHSIIAKTKY
jgi:hypothetical protein